MTPAVVREWHDELCWGVLDAPAVPGGCWAHFSMIRGTGYLKLAPGQQVWITFEPAQQDGFHWRAVQVQLSGNPDQWVDPAPAAGPSGAYQSTLTLSFDDGQEVTIRGDEPWPDFVHRAHDSPSTGEHPGDDRRPG